MRRFLLPTAAALAALVLSVPGWAYPRGGGLRGGSPRGYGPHCPGGPGGPGMHLFGLGRCLLNSPDLALTADQKANLKAVGQEMRQAFREDAPRMREAREAFLRSFANPKVGDDELHRQALAMHDRMKAILDQKWDVMMKVRRILTPEQLAKVPDLPCARPPAGAPPEEPPPDEPEE